MSAFFWIEAITDDTTYILEQRTISAPVTGLKCCNSAGPGKHSLRSSADIYLRILFFTNDSIAFIVPFSIRDETQQSRNYLKPFNILQMRQRMRARSFLLPLTDAFAYNSVIGQFQPLSCALRCKDLQMKAEPRNSVIRHNNLSHIPSPFPYSASAKLCHLFP